MASDKIDVDALNTIAKAAFTRNRLPGLAVAIACREREIFAQGYGHTDASTASPVTADTLFGVASVTKLATAISILQLCDSGDLSLQTPVKHYYPELQAAANPDIHIAHLLRHAAGWRGLGSRFRALDHCRAQLPTGGVTTQLPAGCERPWLEGVDDLVDYMNRCDKVAVAAPDQLLNYSNEGFCLLGGIVAKVSAMPWHHYVERQLFKPLDMSHSAIGVPDHYNACSIATPLIQVNDSWRSAGFWDAPLFYAAGGIVTSCRDLLRLLSLVSDDRPLLSSNSQAWLQQCAIAITSRSASAFGYSAGLEFHRSRSGLCTHWHTGQRAGISSFIAATPANGLRIAVLANVADAPLTTLAFELLSRLDARYCAQWPPIADAPTAPFTPAPIPGRYESEEGFCFDVVRHEDQYFLINANSGQRDELTFQTANSGTAGQCTFAFVAADERAPDRLALDLRVFDRSAG